MESSVGQLNPIKIENRNNEKPHCYSEWLALSVFQISSRRTSKGSSTQVPFMEISVQGVMCSMTPRCFWDRGSCSLSQPQDHWVANRGRSWICALLSLPSKGWGDRHSTWHIFSLHSNPAIPQDPITLSPKTVSEELMVQGHITNKQQARTQTQSMFPLILCTG